MRLIDADALVARIMTDAPDFMDGGSSITKAFIMAMIKTRNVAPTIDAVPVVRCKDCKHAMMTTDGNMCKYCDLYKDDDGFPIELYLEADWFCAGGERKEKEDA